METAYNACLLHLEPPVDEEQSETLLRSISVAELLISGLVKQQISVWTNPKVFLLQSLQHLSNIFGKSSPQGATGTHQGKPSNRSYFEQVVLITVSKVFSTNTGGRLAKKLILGLKARAENYWWAKRLGKISSREGRD